MDRLIHWTFRRPRKVHIQRGRPHVGPAKGVRSERDRPLASALKRSGEPAIPRASDACGHAAAGEESHRQNVGKAAARLVVRRADEAFLMRYASKARWTSCSGQAIQFARSDMCDNLDTCSLGIVLQVPRRLFNGRKEECEIKDYISEEDNQQKHATEATGVTHTRKGH